MEQSGKIPIFSISETLFWNILRNFTGNFFRIYWEYLMGMFHEYSTNIYLPGRIEFRLDYAKRESFCGQAKARISSFKPKFILGINYGIKVIISTIAVIVNIAIVFFQKMKRKLKQRQNNKRTQKVSNISTDGRNVRKTQKYIYRCLEILYIYAKNQYINKMKGITEATIQFLRL